MFITDISYNSHNMTRYYTMIYVTTCLSQIYHIIVITRYYTMIYVTTCLSQIYYIIVITLHDTTLRFMLLHVYH